MSPPSLSASGGNIVNEEFNQRKVESNLVQQLQTDWQTYSILFVFKILCSYSTQRKWNLVQNWLYCHVMSWWRFSSLAHFLISLLSTFWMFRNKSCLELHLEEFHLEYCCYEKHQCSTPPSLSWIPTWDS